jgi:hypothetical protein
MPIQGASRPAYHLPWQQKKNAIVRKETTKETLQEGFFP